MHLPDLQPVAIDHFDSGQLMLEAAAQGLGIAILHADHFDPALLAEYVNTDAVVLRVDDGDAVLEAVADTDAVLVRVLDGDAVMDAGARSARYGGSVDWKIGAEIAASCARA